MSPKAHIPIGMCFGSDCKSPPQAKGKEEAMKIKSEIQKKEESRAATPIHGDIHPRTLMMLTFKINRVKLNP